ncbi:hypothetical protein N9L68_04115 [bacterium]|nr:hypothetical protein [bacterium]
MNNPTWWVTTSKDVAEHLSLQCRGGHEHGECFAGSAETADACKCNAKLCDAILRGSRRTLRRMEPGGMLLFSRALERRICATTGPGQEQFINMRASLVQEASASAVFVQCLGGAEEKGSHIGVYSFVFPEGVKCNASAALNDCIKRVYCNTGHASPEGLARVVRLAVGRGDAVWAATR